MSDHWSVIKKLLLYVLIPVFAVVVVILGVAKLVDVPVTDLLRDANAVLGGEFYVGLFSITGIALWAAAGAMCILLLSTGVPESPRKLLTAGAVVGFMLGASDAYQIHETLPYVWISESVTFSLYGIIAIALFWRSWRYLVSRPNFSVFVVSVLLIGLSLVLDQAYEFGLWTNSGVRAIIEDVAKFLGIVSWVTFFGGFCRALIMTREVAGSSESEAFSTPKFQR